MLMGMLAEREINPGGCNEGSEGNCYKHIAPLKTHEANES